MKFGQFGTSKHYYSDIVIAFRPQVVLCNSVRAFESAQGIPLLWWARDESDV